MYRGTTPTITIETDTDLREAQYVVVTIEDFAKNEISVDSKSGNLTITDLFSHGKVYSSPNLAVDKGAGQHPDPGRGRFWKRDCIKYYVNPNQRRFEGR